MGRDPRVLYNVTRVPMALRIMYHVDTRYMHAWYALETQCNGCIVTMGRKTKGTGKPGALTLTAAEAVEVVAMAVVMMVAVAVEVGCNGLKREWRGFDGRSERGTIG